LLCGVIGTFVVVKRLVFASGGISHAVFGGLGLSHFLGLAPEVGSMGAAVACGLALGAAGSDRFRSNDAMIGVLWSVGMAIGVVFIQLTPGYQPDLSAILFGDILTTTTLQLRVAGALTLGVLIVVGLLFKEFVGVSFDEPFAASQGVPVRRLFTTLMILVAVSVVALIQVVGIILVIALLSIPPLVALRFARKFESLVLASIATSLFMTLGGLALSYRLDLPSGPAIILLGAVALGCISGVHAWSERRALRGAEMDRKPAEEHAA
jgi:zinc transport system permease protein